MNHRSTGVRRHAVGLEGRKFVYFLFFTVPLSFKDLMSQVISFLRGHVLLFSDILSKLQVINRVNKVKSIYRLSSFHSDI